jgi:hypothetical protein
MDAVPVFEGDYWEAVVVKSRLEAEGIEVLFDDLHLGASGRPGHLYVAPADEAAARWIIAACQQSSPERDAEDA